MKISLLFESVPKLYDVRQIVRIRDDDYKSLMDLKGRLLNALSAIAGYQPELAAAYRDVEQMMLQISSSVLGEQQYSPRQVLHIKGRVQELANSLIKMKKILNQYVNYPEMWKVIYNLDVISKYVEDTFYKALGISLRR